MFCLENVTNAQKRSVCGSQSRQDTLACKLHQTKEKIIKWNNIFEVYKKHRAFDNFSAKFISTVHSAYCNNCGLFPRKFIDLFAKYFARKLGLLSLTLKLTSNRKTCHFPTVKNVKEFHLHSSHLNK